VIDDGKYGVLPFTGWKPCDQVYCNLLEGESVFFHGDPIEGNFPLMGKDFILLAGGTSLDVVCNPTIHSFP